MERGGAGPGERRGVLYTESALQAWWVIILDSGCSSTQIAPVRTCVIFNPAAKGEKAGRLRAHLDEIGRQSTLLLTTRAGDARRLASEAVRDGFEIVVAAGGDGTVNEVLNGIGDAPGGFERTRLAVLPLGTMNVFARELRIPSDFDGAWQIVLAGRETRIDLPRVEYSEWGVRRSRCFAQMAGAGLDARAVELVRWETKKRLGPAAYVLAAFQALLGLPAQICARAPGQTHQCGQVLVGNGRLYGGSFRIFPNADLRDGLLEIVILPKVNWITVARCGPSLLLRRRLPASVIRVFQAESLEVSATLQTPLELDGEFVGHLPAQFRIERSRLRVIAPEGVGKP